jgi:hypothetical protein
VYDTYLNLVGLNEEKFTQMASNYGYLITLSPSAIVRQKYVLQEEFTRSENEALRAEIAKHILLLELMSRLHGFFPDKKWVCQGYLCKVELG